MAPRLFNSTLYMPSELSLESSPSLHILAIATVVPLTAHRSRPAGGEAESGTQDCRDKHHHDQRSTTPRFFVLSQYVLGFRWTQWQLIWPRRNSTPVGLSSALSRLMRTET